MSHFKNLDYEMKNEPPEPLDEIDDSKYEETATVTRQDLERALITAGLIVANQTVTAARLEHLRQTLDGLQEDRDDAKRKGEA